jgi:hypothetical protein
VPEITVFWEASSDQDGAERGAEPSGKPSVSMVNRDRAPAFSVTKDCQFFHRQLGRIQHRIRLANSVGVGYAHTCSFRSSEHLISLAKAKGKGDVHHC